MNQSDHDEVKTIVRQEVDNGFLRVRYWIVVSVLAQVVPVLIFGTLFYAQMQSSYDLAVDNQRRLNSRSDFIAYSNARFREIEDHLKEEGFKPAPPPPSYE